MDNPKSVFISYSSKDVDVVSNVVRMLKEAGIKYCKAPEDIPVGSNYAREIPKMISSCEVFLLIISEESQKSIWVEKEIDFAINNKKIIVPLKISNDALTDMFRFYLNNVQMIHYDNQEESLKMLKIRLIGLLSDTSIDANQKVQLSSVSGRPLTDKELRSGLFALNPQPVKCKYCNGELRNISIGRYICMSCGKETDDYYQTIRNFLNKVGPCSITIIEKETGIPRSSIEYFLRQEMLEIPKNCSIRLMCEICGTPIRTGFICESCKSKGFKSHNKYTGEKYMKLRRSK